jgi:hypothetical protein
MTQNETRTDKIACKVNPFPRAFHTSVYFDQQIWVMGGKRAVTDATNDVWYRDNLMPLAVLNDYPDTGSSDALFTFKSNKDGVQYEFMVYFGDRLEVLRPWSRVSSLPFCESGNGKSSLIRSLHPFIY